MGKYACVIPPEAMSPFEFIAPENLQVQGLLTIAYT